MALGKRGFYYPSSSPRVSPESDAPRNQMSCALTRDSSGFGVHLAEAALPRLTTLARKQPSRQAPR